MIKDIQKNKLDYSILALMSSVFVSLFFINSSNTKTQFYLISIFSLSYILWGTYHHWKTRTIHLHIMLEYVLISTLTIIIGAFLLL